MAEDNPVPSLDIDDYEKFLIKLGYRAKGVILQAMLNPLKQYLKEYGVETNKVQPICFIDDRNPNTCKECKGGECMYGEE